MTCSFWGIGRDECRRRADLWPLNPQGDLLFWAMIETKEGVENADAIAQVPGVGGFYLGAGADLSSSYGAESPDDPEVAPPSSGSWRSAGSATSPAEARSLPANAALRMEQGYRIFNFGGANGGLTAANAGGAQRRDRRGGATLRADRLRQHHHRLDRHRQSHFQSGADSDDGRRRFGSDIRGLPPLSRRAEVGSGRSGGLASWLLGLR